MNLAEYGRELIYELSQEEDYIAEESVRRTSRCCDYVPKRRWLCMDQAENTTLDPNKSAFPLINYFQTLKPEQTNVKTQIFQLVQPSHTMLLSVFKPHAGLNH